jgi:hypothetical protein
MAMRRTAYLRDLVDRDVVGVTQEAVHLRLRKLLKSERPGVFAECGKDHPTDHLVASAVVAGDLHYRRRRFGSPPRWKLSPLMPVGIDSRTPRPLDFDTRPTLIVLMPRLLTPN